MNWNEKIQFGLETLKLEGRLRELFQTPSASFVHNDYLGLSSHPQIKEAGKKALNESSCGSQGSRLLGGNDALMEATEKAIADFFGAPSALFFSTGYMANLAAIGSLARLAHQVVSDEKNHASLIDGIRLGGKPKQVVAHNQWQDCPSDEPSLLVSESLFSMDGDWVNFQALKAAWEKGKHFLLLDEAHSAGLFGPQGRGAHHQFPGWDRKAVGVTFGKTFGVAGAAILCSEPVRQWVINHGRTFIFTTAPSPVVVAMVRESLKVVAQADSEREKLFGRCERLRRAWKKAIPDACPWECRTDWDWQSPIIPLWIQGNDRALRFCESMRKCGCDLRAVRYPTVPRGQERVRVSLNLSTSSEEVALLEKKVVEQWMACSSPEQIQT